MAPSSSKVLFLIIVIHLAVICTSLNNGIAQRPPMGWSTWNLYARDFTDAVFYDAVRVFKSTAMKSVGYEYINVDGGWWWSVNQTVYRNGTGFAFVDPYKYPDGIQSVIDFIHSHGFKYGHYTNAGTNACDGDADMSEYYMSQDIALFISWGIDMIKVDACAVQGNDTSIIFEWRDDLNATGRPVLFSNCRNQCLYNDWKPWCTGLANMWRVSEDISASWDSMVSNLDATKSLGQFAQPMAWNDPDFLEVDIGEFAYDGSGQSLRMNQAHFSLWCIVSAPLIVGMNITNVSEDILQVITNADAVAVNQNYLNHGGDVITEFKVLSESFIDEYLQQMQKNDNMTELFYKPLPKTVGDAALLFLNRALNESYHVQLDFSQLPLTSNHDGKLYCISKDIWAHAINNNTSSMASLLPPQSVQFILLSDCQSL